MASVSVTLNELQLLSLIFNDTKHCAAFLRQLRFLLRGRRWWSSTVLVTADEGGVLRAGWTEIGLYQYEGWVVVRMRTLYARDRRQESSGCVECDLLGDWSRENGSNQVCSEQLRWRWYWLFWNLGRVGSNTTKFINMRIVGFTPSRTLVWESEMFNKNKTKIASWLIN